MKSTKCAAKEKKKYARKSKDEGKKESEKKKSRLLCHFKSQKLYFLRTPELGKLIFCT